MQSELYPDHLAHIVVVTVERNQTATHVELLTSSTVSSISPSLSSFETLSLCSIQNGARSFESTPKTPQEQSRDDVIFLPSPGSNMTHSDFYSATKPTPDNGAQKLALLTSALTLPAL